MIRQAVLLLGGRGTRLWPLTDRRPKGLLPVAGLPFFEYQIRLLAEVGIEEIFLAVGRASASEWGEYLSTRPDLAGVRLTIEEEPLDTAGPVRAILSSLEDRFITLNGDVLFDADLSDLISRSPDAPAVLALTPVDDPSAFGVVLVDEDGAVQDFVEKPSRASAPANTISAGIYLLTPAALAEFPEGPLSFEREVWPRLADEGRLGAVVTEGAWMDIGTPRLYVDAHRFVAEGRCRVHRPEEASPHGSGIVSGSVEGFAWLGEGAELQAEASITDSIVLPGAVIETKASVSRSVVGWGAVVRTGANVSDYSLVGEGATVGSGCEVRGLRIAPGAQLSKRAITVEPPT